MVQAARTAGREKRTIRPTQIKGPTGGRTAGGAPSTRPSIQKERVCMCKEEVRVKCTSP